MIKLKKLLKEGIYGKFWWMDSRGRLTRVMKVDLNDGHVQSAIEILKSINIIPSSKNIYQQMYDLGWIRVAFTGNESYYSLSFNLGVSKEPSAIQMDSLKDLATELNAHEIRNNATRKTYPFGNF